MTAGLVLGASAPHLTAHAASPPREANADKALTGEATSAKAPEARSTPLPSASAPDYRTTVTDEEDRPLAAQRDADARSVGTVSVVEVDAVVGATPADAATELVHRLPGASVRSLGGLGQFASVSVRGSTAQQLQLAMDGVPLNDGFAGLFDLGQASLETLGRIELYRGHVPLRFGGAAQGGVLHLVSRPIAGTRTRGVAGVGSFGASQFTATHEQRLGRRWGVAVNVAYAGAEGDFPYYDTGDTPSTADDDSVLRRGNNGYARGNAELRVEGRGAGWRWMLRQRVGTRRQEIAGPATAPARDASLRTADARWISVGRLRLAARPGSYVRAHVGLHLRRRTFDDPQGEVGLGTGSQRTETADLYLAPELRVAAWPGAFLTATASARQEWIGVRTDAGEALEQVDHRRLTLGAGLSVAQWLASDRVRLDAIFYATAVQSKVAAADLDPGGSAGRDALDLGWAPRAAARWIVHKEVDLRASVGTYFRPPTLLELFGDRGFAVGDAALRPERGLNGDASVIWTRALEGVTDGASRLALSGFVNDGRDTITWIQTAQVVRPRNLGRTLAAGMEVSASLSLWSDALAIDAAYTFLDARRRDGVDGQDGAPLPGRPRHQANARVSGGYTFRPGGLALRPRVAYDLDAVASTYLDPSGRFSLPPRILHGVAAQLGVGDALVLAVEVRNLTDRLSTTWTPSAVASTAQVVPITDFIGYPLPGRSLWLTARVGAW